MSQGGAAWQAMEPEAILSVFFEGTANTLRPPTTQIGLFAEACAAHDLTPPEARVPRDETAFKMQFDGCGVTNGLSGTLFAEGLREQCGRVHYRVEQLLARFRSVRVNALGLSRGGIACIFLAQALAPLPRARLAMLLYDPVPGDLTWSGVPFTGVRAKDLRHCENLERVLAVYPHEPLPDFTFHAPVLPAYPPACAVEEDATLGCHQGALFRTGRGERFAASNLSFRRILEFMTEIGTAFERLEVFAHQPSEAECLEHCRVALRNRWPQHRAAHSFEGGRAVVRHPNGRYLNKYHERLEDALGGGGGGGGGGGAPARDDEGDDDEGALDGAASRAERKAARKKAQEKAAKERAAEEKLAAKYNGLPWYMLECTPAPTSDCTVQ